MKIKQIEEFLANSGKPVTRQTLYRYLKRLGITQTAARQRPALYPADTGVQICRHLGLEPMEPKTKIVSLRELKKGRSK